MKSKNTVTKFYTVRMTGAEITLIVAALMAFKFPGAKTLARRLLERVTK